MRKPGIYNDISIDIYHSEEGISSSGISLILDCPKRYWFEYLSGEADKKNDKCFDIGRALHMSVLEPEKFDLNFYLMNESVDLRTKAGKEHYAKCEEEANGRTIIRSEDAHKIKEMSKSILKHQVWGKISGYRYIEQSIYWDSGIYDTRLRARPDLFTDELIIDLKTTDSISAFQNSLFQFGYHRQGAMQIDGLEASDGKKRIFGLFVVEKKAPYLTACFTLDELGIQKGRKEYTEGAAIYSECLKYNSWPGYEDNFSVIHLPKWMQGEAA